MTTALFPGSFNPFTIGHADIVERALTIFDRVVIGVGHNITKDADDIAERVEAISKLYVNNESVSVQQFSGLTVDFAKEVGANTIIKGVRDVKDFEYERTQADINSRIGEGIETVVLFARPELASISSSVVRELKHFGKDIKPFIP